MLGLFTSAWKKIPTRGWLVVFRVPFFGGVFSRTPFKKPTPIRGFGTPFSVVFKGTLQTKLPIRRMSKQKSRRTPTGNPPIWGMSNLKRDAPPRSASDRISPRPRSGAQTWSRPCPGDETLVRGQPKGLGDGRVGFNVHPGFINPWLILNRGVSPFSGDSDHFWREHAPDSGTGLLILSQH